MTALAGVQAGGSVVGDRGDRRLAAPDAPASGLVAPGGGLGGSSRATRSGPAAAETVSVANVPGREIDRHLHDPVDLRRLAERAPDPDLVDQHLDLGADQPVAARRR